MSYSKQEEEKLKRHIAHKLKDILNSQRDNPVLQAHGAWEIVSEQLRHLLGEEVHRQWFRNSRPLVMNNKTLIVQTESLFAAQWIYTHYHELVEGLLQAQDRQYSCFFIAPKKNQPKKPHFYKRW